MNNEEKVMQLSAVYPMGLMGTEGPIHSELEAQLGRGIGHVPDLYDGTQDARDNR